MCSFCQLGFLGQRSIGISFLHIKKFFTSISSLCLQWQKSTGCSLIWTGSMLFLFLCWQILFQTSATQFIIKSLFNFIVIAFGLELGFITCLYWRNISLHAITKDIFSLPFFPALQTSCLSPLIICSSIFYSPVVMSVFNCSSTALISSIKVFISSYAHFVSLWFFLTNFRFYFQLFFIFHSAFVMHIFNYLCPAFIFSFAISFFLVSSMSLFSSFQLSFTSVFSYSCPVFIYTCVDFIFSC